jgi:hypothetical protein
MSPTWMKVSLVYDDALAGREAAKALMEKVSATCRAAGGAKHAKAYRARLTAIGNIFYFPPTVAAVAAKVLSEYEATDCDAPLPDTLTPIDL